MLTPMTNESERRRAARERLEARYWSRQEREDEQPCGFTAPLLLHTVLDRVMVTAENQGNHPTYAPEDPDSDDLLAALALVGEAREQLDDFELRLIREARRREVTWTDLASSLGMRTRQSAESRAVRLERAATTSHQSRDVGQMRAKRAGERNLERWATMTEPRLRATAEAVVDSSAAWGDTDVEDRAAFAGHIQALAAHLVSGAEGLALWSALQAVSGQLLPSHRRNPKPGGDVAAAATAAAHELDQLLVLANRAKDTL